MTEVNMTDEEMEKKADALLDGKKPDEEATETEPKKEKLDPATLLQELCRGKLTLLTPIRAHSQDVTEIKFDFCSLTGMDLMDAMDSAPAGNNLLGLNNKQALALFCKTAEKCAPMIEDGGKLTRLFDAKDVRERMGASDAVSAVQLAKLFYNASSQAGSRNISKE